MNEPLAISLLQWLVAAVPIVALFVLLVGLRWMAPQAGSVALILAAVIAVSVFQAPLENAAVAGGKGVWDSIFILAVIWPAFLLYRVADRAGAFDALHHGIQRFSRNELFLVLAFGWVFSSFLQGIAGFGVPIAVVAPLLVGLGVRPIYAVVIPLIGHVWAKMFGTLAVGWLATLQVVDLENELQTAVESGVLLWIPDLLGALGIAWLYGRSPAMLHALPMILVVSLIHGGGQLALMFWDPILSTFIAGTVAMVLLYPLAKWRRYAEPPEGIAETPAMREDRGLLGAVDDAGQPRMSLSMALLPYAVLTVVTLAALVVAPVKDLLTGIRIGPSFPATGTPLGIEIPAELPYAPLAPLAHPGTFLLVAAVVGWAVYRRRGFYARPGVGQAGIRSSVVNDALPASVATVAFLVMSRVMDHSGQTDVLALGLAAVASAPVYAFLANFIGVVGAFMTSSSTASNILFAPLQEQTAEALGGLRESTIIAAQSAGGAVGNAIAPANVMLGTGTTGIVGREGEVMRKTLPWTGVTALCVGLATLVLNTIGER